LNQTRTFMEHRHRPSTGFVKLQKTVAAVALVP
jgi:hypothetical protein